jgi:autotransporter translocation and assembly factor TamB
VRKSEDDVALDVRAEVSPLSLTALAAYFPDLPFSGEVTGSIQASGPLGNLTLRTDLETEAGRLALDARFDARDPGAYYQLEGDLGDFALSRLVPELPEPTLVNGTLRLEGRGADLRTAEIDASLSARASRIWELDVDSARLAVRAREGVLYVDTASALVSGVTLIAGGTLATHAEGPPGEIRVIVQSDSLQALRPVLMGRDVRVRDGLTELEREALRAQGIDPDTLPTAEEVVVSGRVEGEATLRGALDQFSIEGAAALEEVRYGTRSLSGARVTFAASGLPDLREAWSARMEADSLSVAGLGFRSADVAVSYQDPAGRAEVFLERNENENYRAIARFQVDSLGGRVDLETLALRMDSVTWNLERPAAVTWDSAAVRVSGLALAQAEDPAARIEVDGVLPDDGQVDLSVDVQGLRLEHVSRMLQRERSELGGVVHLDLTVRGQAAQPLIIGSLSATEVSYQDYSLDLVQGQVAYRERRLDVVLEAREGELRVLRATGFIPAALNLSEPAFELPDEPIDLQVVADSLPAAFAAGIFPALVDVQGTVAGEFDIGGTLDDPEPSGELVLQNAAWTIEALGVRHDNVSGTLTLRPDAIMEVDASARADGVAYMSGTVLLAPLRNPEFDLTISFNNFRAAERRDVDGNVTGVISLTGTFDRPVVQGLTDEGSGLYVDQGVLYVEEAVRSATVVDLADPRFAGFVDPSILEPSLLEESRNPFMQNLFVNVDLVVEQDTWLRSSDMNVEIAGNLAVRYDRSRMELFLVGELQALRGPYSVLGRRFDVQQGTIEFIGIPGINPNLDILARTRVRREGDPLDITARVTGTLQEPRVTLSSEEAAVSQSDLVSYLLFGMPSYELASTQRQLLGSTTPAFVGAGVSAVVSGIRGSLTTGLGAVLARQTSLDYFAITEAGNLGWDVGAISQTQVEVGEYLSQDVFLALAFQPAQIVGGSSNLLSVGLRLEFTPTEAYTLQAFWEDRFLRRRTIGFQDAAFRSEKILGLWIFTEWGF